MTLDEDGDGRMPRGDDPRTRAVRAVEAELQDLVGRVRRQIAAAAERLSPGLAPIAYKTFAAIARRGPVTASTLGEHLGLDKGLLSRTIGQLEQLGLVARTPDPTDGRASLVAATPDGLARLSASRATAGDPVREATAAWDVADIDRLAALLHALAERAAPAASVAPTPAAHAPAPA